MENSASQEQIIRPKPRITQVAQNADENIPYKVGKELLALNNNWGAPLLQQLSFSYVVHAPETPAGPTTINYFTEHNLPQQDKETQNSLKLEKKTIMQYLNRTSINVENGQVFNLRPISNVASSTKKNEPFFSLPPPLSSLSVTCLHVVLSPIEVHGSSITLMNYQGCLFIIDKETKSVCTEAAYFYTNDGQPKFIQTNGTDLYFEVQNCKDNLLLVIILMHSEAINIDDFVNKIMTQGTPVDDYKKTPIPFAYSYIMPFQENNNSNVFSFNFPWTKVMPNDHFETLFSNESNSDSVSLIGKATIEILPFENLPRVRLTSEENESNKENSNLLALSIPQRTFFPTSIISLSSIAFSFNNPPKGDYAIFRVYLSDNLTDPLNPSSLAVFISKAHEPISAFYESVGMPMSKYIVFPDIVRMRLDKPLTPTSNIVIQFFTVDSSGPKIYKLTAFPLFVDNNIIQTSALMCYTHPSKDLKGAPDYLIKCQKYKKSNATFHIDIPQVFYPSNHLSDLATALVPQQVKYTVLRQLQPKILLPQLIPIISKLFSIISPLSVTYLLDMISMFKPEESKPQLKSWLFHNFDPKIAKYNFLSSFTNSFNELILTATEQSDEAIFNNLIKSFDVICDILITSFMLKQENFFPASLFKMFTSISHVMCYICKKGKVNEVVKMNSIFGDTLFIFHSLTDNKYIMDAVRIHIVKIIELEKPDLLFLIWDFLMRFTDTNEFAIFIASHFPVKPITRNLFSPFYSVSSIIYLAVVKTFESENLNSISLCCNFICRLFLPMENEDVKIGMRYRVAYAFFPLFVIIVFSYNKLEQAQRIELLPAILFMLGYSPQQLLRYNFLSNATPKILERFLSFLENSIDTVLDAIGPNSYTITPLNGVFDELTKRILQFLNYNVRGLRDFLKDAIFLLSKLIESPHQVSNNYPLLFDTVFRVIHYYPCQKSLVSSLLNSVMKKQHLVRCFATSLILLFFKSDYDTRKTIVVSSAEVLDSVANIMLQLDKDSSIGMYKLMLNTISEMSFDVFKNQDFTDKLTETTTAANKIADLIIKFKKTSLVEGIRNAMKIADENMNYPSMRVNWLRKIVGLNQENNNLSSAFVAQLHICALIATVIMHENSLECSIETSEFKKQFNYLVCQPISQDKKFILSHRFFEFFPSVLVEKNIDFNKISEGFKFIASEFTLQYLNENLITAINIGLKAHLYYSVRPLYSLQLRIMNDLGKYKVMGEICQDASELFKKLKANGTLTYTTPITFFAISSEDGRNFIYAIDNANLSKFVGEMQQRNVKFERVLEQEKGFNSMFNEPNKNSEVNDNEHQHCWNVFHSRPSLSCINEAAKNIEKKLVELVQYTTSEPLPSYINFMPAVEQKAYITLVSYVKMEAKVVLLLIERYAEAFDGFFPCASSNSNYGDYKIHYKDDIERIVYALKKIFPYQGNTPNSATSDEAAEQSNSIENEDGQNEEEKKALNEPAKNDLNDLPVLKDEFCLFTLLKILNDNGGAENAKHFAKKLRKFIVRLLAVFKTAIDASNESKFLSDYNWAKNMLLSFSNEFGLNEVEEIRPYQGEVDPLLEKFDYE